MRYELNFDEDKIIDIGAIGDNGVLGLKDCCKIMNEQEAIINKLKEDNDRIKTKGLDVLAFYESKIKDVVGTEDFQHVCDEIWIVRQVLYEMGVIDDK